MQREEDLEDSSKWDEKTLKEVIELNEKKYKS